MTDETVSAAPVPVSIRDLYEAVLTREPAVEEVRHWEGQLSGGMSMRQILEAFVQSDEFRFTYARRAGMWVPPGHFYSPLVDVTSAPRFLSDPPLAIAVNVAEQRELWHRCVPMFREMPFSDKRSPDYRYWFDNPAYGYADAMMYYAMLRTYQPARVIEVGSGYSSALLLDIAELHLPETRITFIEPYPELLLSLMRADDRSRCTVLPQRVQDVPLSIFSDLHSGDVLFIDSTHVAKTGSDVVCELLEVLPRLEAGVLIHIHDIFWPFEYPESWVIEENRSWNETYVLRAFLMYNDAFEIVFWNDYFVKQCWGEIEAEEPRFLLNTGGSLWLRKR
jgi:predicted O-methyltransferase YrrM